MIEEKIQLTFQYIDTLLTNHGTENDADSDDTLLKNMKLLAFYLYRGWLNDVQMNSPVIEEMAAASKNGLVLNKKRNEYIENIDKYFMSIQKGTGEKYLFGIGVGIDKLIVLYLRKQHSSDNVKKQILEKQINYIKNVLDNLCNDLLLGNKQIILLSFIKDYME